MINLRKGMLILLLTVTIVLLSGCSAVDGIERIMISEDNTSVKQTVEDTNNIMQALKEANTAMKNLDTKVFGQKVLSEGLSYKDVIEAKDLKEAAQTKRYKDVIYHAYWDKDGKGLFWSSDGLDDLRNADGNFHVTHKNSKRIINSTPANELT